MMLAELLGSQRVLPLVEVDDAAQAIELARVIVDHGSPEIEIALRTPGAISAIEAVRSSVADALVGAGTVMSPDQLSHVAAAGAAFAVEPRIERLAVVRGGRLSDPVHAGTAIEIAQAFRAMGTREVVVTDGPGPCVVALEDVVESIDAIRPGDVTDTTAAGDAFDAGYIAARLRDGTPARRAAAGHALAATVVRHRGAFAPERTES